MLDLIAVPSHLAAAWGVRAAVLLATGAVTLAAHRSRAAFLRHYAVITCLLYLCWGIGTEAIILLTGRSDPGWTTYYSGLILISIALYSLTYLCPLQAGMTGLALALAYVVPALTVQQMGEGAQCIVLVQNSFFLVGANLLGLFASSLRDRCSRQGFLLKNALSRELRAEEEAKRRMPGCRSCSAWPLRPGSRARSATRSR